MSDLPPVDMLRLVDGLNPAGDGEHPATPRTATVTAVNGDGTVDVVWSGGTVPSVPVLAGAVVQVGQPVQMLTGPQRPLVLGTVRTVAEGQWELWTPELTSTGTNPTLGTGSVAEGQYVRSGDVVHAQGFIRFGTSGATAGTGSYLLSVPVAYDTTVASSLAVGSGDLNDASPATRQVVSLSRSSGGRLAMVCDVGVVGAGIPWTWAASDFLRWTVAYRAAP